MITKSKNGLKISKEKSEDVNRMTDNVKRQRIKRPTMVDKTLHRLNKTNTSKPWVNLGAMEG